MRELKEGNRKEEIAESSDGQNAARTYGYYEKKWSFWKKEESKFKWLQAILKSQGRLAEWACPPHRFAAFHHQLVGDSSHSPSVFYLI